MRNGIFIFVEPEIYNGEVSINEKQIDFTEEEIERTKKLIKIIPTLIWLMG